MTQHVPPQIAEDDAPGLCLDSGEFIPASQLSQPHCMPLNPSSIERRVHVTSEGVRFGNCWISHASLMEGHGAIVQRGYEAWLNLPDWDLPKG